MKNKTFPGLLVLVITLLTSCTASKKSASGEAKKNDTKEVFKELSNSEHVKALKLSPVQISTIQMYASKPFQLTATSYSQSVLVEEGALILQKESLGTIVKFKDKIKGKVVSIPTNGVIIIQFHDGSDNNIGPEIPFSATGNGWYRIAPRNGVILYSGVNYTPSDVDVVLMIKFKERISSKQNSFSASGIEVNGGGNTDSNDSNNGGNQQQQQNDFVPDANQQNQNQQPANPEPRNPPAQQGNPFNVPPRAPH